MLAYNHTYIRICTLLKEVYPFLSCDILSKIIFMQRWETFVFCVKTSFISIFSCDWIWNYLTDWTETSLILPDCDLILWPVKCATFYINLKEWQMRFVINKKNNLFDLGHCDLLFLLSSNLNDMFILSIYLLLHKIKGQQIEAYTILLQSSCFKYLLGLR